MENFDKMVRSNQIQNCLITSKDITNEIFIFGTHLSGVRGDKVRRTLKRVDSDRVTIPIEFQLLHESVTLVVNLFFVGGITFLIALSRKLCFVDVGHM